MTATAEPTPLPGRRADPVRFLLVGTGIIAGRHADLLAAEPDAVLVGIVSRDPARTAARAAELGAPAFGSIAAALAATSAEAVVVCTPTGNHAEAALEALRLGRHVLIEKPADTTVARIDELVAAQRAAGTEVGVISQRRFEPASERVLRAIEDGELGRLTSAVASVDLWRGQSYYDSADWRGSWRYDGGGALMNQGIHTVDLMLALMGPAVEVTGRTATLAHDRLETEDVAVGVVAFASGAVGTLHASTAVFPGIGSRLQVHGDRGSAILAEGGLAHLHTTPPGAERPEIGFGTEDALQPVALPGGGDPMALQYRNFIAAVRGTERLRVGLPENRAAVALVTGLYESARSGRPVDLTAG